MRAPQDVFDMFADAMRAQDGLWREDAACRDAPTEVFFPEDRGDYRAAVELCASCPVTGECLESWRKAPRLQQGYGVWGGVPGYKLVKAARG